MALADQADVEARLRRALTEGESSYIDDVLEEASVLVSEHCGGREFDPVPDAVRLVVSRVAARALTGSDVTGTASFTDQAGPYQQVRTLTRDAANGNVYLNAVDRRYLRRWSVRGAYSFDTR